MGAGAGAAGGLRADHEPFHNRGFAFEAPAFRYGSFAVVELTKVRGMLMQ